MLNVSHRTEYKYANPVTFGPHRMTMRPRDSHDLRLLETALTITPAASVRWLHDVFGNSVAIADFKEPANELVVVSSFRAEHYPLSEAGVTLEEFARHYPFTYDASEISRSGADGGAALSGSGSSGGCVGAALCRAAARRRYDGDRDSHGARDQG